MDRKTLVSKRVESVKPLSPVVKHLGWVSFFADVASEMLYPVTPIFLRAVVGANMTQLGLIEGLAEALANLLKTPVGRWSDRLGQRKVFLFFGYLLSALAKPVLVLSQVWWQVFVSRSLDRLGKGLRTAPRDAWIADEVPPKERGRAFGLHRAMDTAGAVVGPLMALVILWLWPQLSLRYLYVVALIPGLVSVWLVWRLNEKKKAVSYVTWQKKEDLRDLSTPIIANESSHTSSTSRSVFLFLGLWFLFSLGNSSDAFLIVRLKEAGLSLTQVVLLYCAYNGVYATLSPFLGRLSDRLEKAKLLAGGLLIYVAVYTGFALTNQPVVLVTLLLLYGVYQAATDGVSKALLANLVSGERRGYYMGLHASITSMGMLLASLGGGWLWDRWGAQVTFGAGAFFALVAAMGLWLFQVAGAFAKPLK